MNSVEHFFLCYVKFTVTVHELKSFKQEHKNEAKIVHAYVGQ
jgi:hypothetical protein